MLVPLYSVFLTTIVGYALLGLFPLLMKTGILVGQGILSYSFSKAIRQKARSLIRNDLTIREEFIRIRDNRDDD